MASNAKGFNTSNLKLVDHVLKNFVQNNVFDTPFIHQDYCPVIPVNSLVGKFYVMKDGSYFELAREYVGGVWAEAGGEDWTSSTYDCHYWAAGWHATKDDLKEADSQLNLLQNRIATAVKKVERRKEYEFFALVGATASYGTRLSLTTNDCWVTSVGVAVATATIHDNVVLMKRYVASATGYQYEANTMFIPAIVADGIQTHPEIYSITKYTNPDLIHESGIPMRLWGLKVVVVKGRYVSISGAKAASPSKTAMLSDKVGFAHINMSDPEKSWIVRFQRYGRRMMINENNDKVISGDVSEVFDTKVIHTAMASLLDNVVQG